MNISQITETLIKSFNEHRIVFWNDAEREFTDSLPEIIPADVKVLRIDEIGALAAKIKIELEAPDEKFLVYSPTAQPTAEDDWLLDIRLYSSNFTADSASLLLNDLGLESQILRAFLGKRKQFFKSKDRLQKLKRWVLPDDNEKELNKKMLAVAVRADQAEIFTILLKVFGEVVRTSDKNKPDILNEIEKFDLDEFFWLSVKETFGYAEEKPRLFDLIVRLFVTDFANYVRDALPGALKALVLDSRTGAHNSSVFLANWRMNVASQDDYRNSSQLIAKEIDIDRWIEDIPAHNLAECETFEAAERRIISDLRNRLLEPLPSETGSFKELIDARCDRFWCRNDGESYRAVYDAFAAALEFYSLLGQYEKGFNFSSAAAIFKTYTEELFRFDQLYRKFFTANREIKFEGWDVLKPLSEKIEMAYGSWYLENLGTVWGKSVEHEKLFENWRFDGAPNQYEFFKRFVRPLAKESSERKIYVIVSDAFRFECAEELTRELNTEARKSGKALLEAELSAMLGVVPSYTALGMASLLPHEELDYKKTNPNADTLYVDEKSTSGHANRDAVLKKHNGIAVKSEDFLNLGKDEGRDFVRNCQIIYIYHNVIDATGDSASTESDTFLAVGQTFTELRSIVNFIFNSLNGSQIFITADHGFLFQENSPEQLDKSSLEVKSDEVLKRKKRYVINPTIAPQANAWHGKIRKTSGIVGEMEFLIPKGANRFHFTGGSRFVHGGAMPQEICVPVITIKKLRGQAAADSAVSRVGVTLLGNVARIVNNVQRLEFIQTEAVSERNLPRTLQISLQDENAGIISNEVTLTFDSSSDSMEERKRTAQLTLRTGNYDRKKPFFLVLADNEAVVKEYQRISVIIDIAFSRDF